MNKKYIKELQDSGMNFFVAATGGGTSFLGEFLKVSGGSKCILGGYVPYAVEATNLFLGTKLKKYSDGNAARKLGVAAFEQAAKIFNANRDKSNYIESYCVGVGVACSLAKENEREGREHTINISIQTANKTRGISVTLQKSTLSRETEEHFVNNLILMELFSEFGRRIDEEWNEMMNRLLKQENCVVERFTANNPCVCGIFPYNPFASEKMYLDFPQPQYGQDLVIYPGSFNPFHSGHAEILRLAEEITAQSVFLELTVTNSYKPRMDYVDLKSRIANFPTKNYIVTHAPRFVDKVRLLKHHYNCRQIIIVVGADTWERVYDDAAHKNGDIKFFEDNNVKFLVFGRNTEIKNTEAKIFFSDERALDYFNPVSSTQLRDKNQ